MCSFRVPAGLIESIKSVCKEEQINQSQFVRAALTLALDLWYDQETGEEIIEDERK